MLPTLIELTNSYNHFKALCEEGDPVGLSTILGFLGRPEAGEAFQLSVTEFIMRNPYTQQQLLLEESPFRLKFVACVAQQLTPARAQRCISACLQNDNTFKSLWLEVLLEAIHNRCPYINSDLCEPLRDVLHHQNDPRVQAQIHQLLVALGDFSTLKDVRALSLVQGNESVAWTTFHTLDDLRNQLRHGSIRLNHRHFMDFVKTQDQAMINWCIDYIKNQIYQNRYLVLYAGLLVDSRVREQCWTILEEAERRDLLYKLSARQPIIQNDIDPQLITDIYAQLLQSPSPQWQHFAFDMIQMNPDLFQQCPWLHSYLEQML